MSQWVNLSLIAALVLFAGACVGHVALMVLSHNWWYAAPVSKKVGKLLRLVHALLMLAGPLLFWAVFGLDLPTNFDWLSEDGWRPVLAVYIWLCWLVGFGVFPIITVARATQRPPEVLVSNHTRTMDVTARLGYPPIGRGKYRHLARLPRNEVFQVDFVERMFHLPQLPAAWDGLSILHLSDLHLCGTPDREYFRCVFDGCNEWEPDLVALTGDIVETSRHHRWIVPLLGRLRWRVAAFAILGNHDYWRDPSLIRRRLKRIGMTVLGNSWQTIRVRDEPLIVVGHEGPWFKPAPDLSSCPAEGFRVCLSHTPDNMGWARRNHIDLMLSGHNHGGQIRFPVIGSVFVPSRFSRRYDCGIFHEPPTLLHVSRGLAGEHPLRYNCRPEVTKIILRAASPPSPV